LVDILVQEIELELKEACQLSGARLIQFESTLAKADLKIDAIDRPKSEDVPALGT
jgi:hypothetical protein